MTLQEIIDSLQDQAQDKDNLAIGDPFGPDDPENIFAQDAKALREAARLLGEMKLPNDPLTLEELREMDDADVWVSYPSSLSGDRLIMHALVEVVKENGVVWLTNNLGGRSTFDEVSEGGGLAYRRKPEEGTTNYEAEDTHREENVKKLLALVKDNPNLPIIPMVDADLCVDDFGIYMGGFGAARVDSYVIDRCDMVLFKSDDDVFDTLERCLSKEEFETLPEAESECRLIYEALPWKEAIVVNIVIPEDGTT